jgi:hypothetical protein
MGNRGKEEDKGRERENKLLKREREREEGQKKV